MLACLPPRCWPRSEPGTSGIAAILLTSILWGTTGTAATFAPDAGPLAIGAAALGIGGLLQALIALPSLRRSWEALRAHAGLVLPSTATTLTLTSLAVAAVLAVIVVDERLTITGWIGLAVISAALIVLAPAPPTSPTHGTEAGRSILPARPPHRAEPKVAR